MKSIFLIGMPGAGKSTVGRLLASALNRPFVDSDEEIVRRNGVEIGTIFEIEGEAGFRAREAAVIDELTQHEAIVLATGGGAVLREDNRRALHSRGCVVYLRAGLDILVLRTQRKPGANAATSRPLLEAPNRRERLQGLLEVREPLYNEIAHVTIESNTSQRARFLQKLLAALEAVEATTSPRNGE